MEINTNLPAGGVNAPIPSKRATTAPKQAAAPAPAGLSALQGALQNAPETRMSEVVRAGGLVSDVAYPPLETIRKISKLLAINIGNEGK